jgi:TrmH family RNA methyltransferase
MNRISLLSVNKQKLLRKAHQKKYRQQLDFYFGEGYRLLTAALENPETKIVEIILADKVIGTPQGSSILRAANSRHIYIYRATDRQMHLISTEVTPPGIFFTIQRPSPADADLQTSHEPVVVFLEQISDAGNLGTILRSMIWFGFTALVLSPGCVDVYNPKAVRASAGAIFSARIYPDISLSQAVAILKPKGYSVAAAVSSGGLPLEKIKDKQQIMLVFGSEASGLSDSALKLVDLKVTIPSKSNMDSLNLAVSAGIMFYGLSV